MRPNEILLADTVFTPEECDLIVAAFKDGPYEPGLVSANKDAPEIRRSDIQFVPPSETYAWIFERLATAASSGNHQAYQFDIARLEEGFQFARYTPGGHYAWHSDLGDEDERVRRKVSIVLHLNDDYEGGQLQFFPVRVQVPARKGLLALFPSFLVHRVAPVTAGVRYSLAAWVAGERAFK